MDGVFCQSLSLDCVSQSANTNVCLDLCDPEPSLSFLPIWKRELIRKKRLSNGVGSCNVHQGWRGARGGAPAIILGLENQSRERLRIANKGLVASLQAVYEPLVGVRAGGEREPPAARLASSSSSSSGLAMLARPWQAGALHSGSEPASSPPPLPKSPQLGAASQEHPSPAIEAFSSSQSRSVSGRSPSRFSSVDAVPAAAAAARLVNGANSGSHVTEPVPLNHYQTPTSTIPTRRLSEPNRTRSSAATMVEETRLKSSAASQIDMVDNKAKISSKGLHAWKTMTGNRDNEDEELQYGPGIVNKLKSRYLSRTLRERPLGESRRPSLRRAASLEDWLDKDSSPPHQAIPSDVLVRSANGRTKMERPVSLNLAAPVVESKPPVSVSPVKVRDLKKTRSVDCVSQPAWRSVSVADLVVSPPQQSKPTQTQTTALPPASPKTPSSPKTPVHLLLSKDAIVIVEKDGSQASKTETKQGNVHVSSPTTSTVPSSTSSRSRRTLPINSRYNVEDAELPAPDTVRQVKRIFESGSSRKTPSTRRSQSAGPGLNRIPLSAANQSTDKMNVHRMNQLNQVNLVNNKSANSVARKKSDTATPRIVEFADTKPVVITKVIGPKPVLSPKPAVIIDKTRVAQSSPGGATSLQRTAIPPKPVATPVVVSTPAVKEESPVQPEDEDDIDEGGARHGFKIISKTALENIHKESTTVKFNFEEKKDEKLAPSIPVGIVQSKQVGVIRPQLKSPAIQTEKVVLVEDSSSKDSIDTLPKKEEITVTPSIAVTKVRAQQTELPQPQTTKPVIPVPSPASASKSQPVVSANRTKQPQPAAGPTVLKLEPVTTVTDARSASPVYFGSAVSPSTTPVVDKKATDNPIIVSVPMVKILSSSSQISKPSANTLTTNSATTIGAHSPSNVTTNREQKKQWHPHQSETTTVFNFVNDTSRNTDHIRNEGGSSGILVYKSNDSGITKLPDYDPGESSDFIDDLDILKRPPSPCNVDFEGANVIVGKSLIQRRSKKAKMNITFNDEMTALFEYPSETSLLEEGDVKMKQSEQDLREITSSHNSATNSKGGLSSYTPSKVHIETPFELGVSRPLLPDPPHSNPPLSSVSQTGAGNYIKPAEESTTWSAETTSDLLF